MTKEVKKEDILKKYNLKNKQGTKKQFEELKDLIKTNKLDFTEKINDEYRLIDFVVLKMFDYNNFGDNKKTVKNFVENNKKEILNVIYKDTTENNPIALIMRNRTSSIFLDELIENIDWSKDNIEKQPGLKMLTTSLKTITPSVYHHPSDFVVLLTEKLNKYEHLKDFTNKLNLGYIVSNMFGYQPISEINKENLTELTKSELINQKEFINDRNQNSFYQTVFTNAMEYLKVINEKDLESFKKQLKEDLWSDLNKINLYVAHKVIGHEPKDIENFCAKLKINVNNLMVEENSWRSMTFKDFVIEEEKNKFQNNLHNIGKVLKEETINEKLIERCVECLKNDPFVNNLNENEKRTKNNSNLEKNIEDILNKLKVENFTEKNKKIFYKNSEALDTRYDNNLFYLKNNIDLGLETLSFAMSKSKERKIVNQLMDNDKIHAALNTRKIESLSIEQIKNISNNIIDPLVGIVKLKDIFPNREIILDSILSNLDDLIDGKKQIGLMGEIKNKEMKTVNTELKGDNEKIIKLLNPLIKELEKIKEKYHSIYVEDIGPHKSMKI